MALSPRGAALVEMRWPVLNFGLDFDDFPLQSPEPLGQEGQAAIQVRLFAVAPSKRLVFLE